jgi:hypothetical protein
MGVSAAAWFIRADEQPDTHGEVVWFWHPGADADLAVMIR